jgi:TRAP-type C4-dicarboxylate transport system permease small subunit
VNVDLVPLALPQRARRALAIVTLGLSIAIIAMMLWYGYEFWHFAFERGWRSDTVWGPPLWIPYLSIPVGLGLLLLQLVADLVAVILRIDTPFGLEEV